MEIYFLFLLALCNSYELFEEYYEEAEKYMKKMTIEDKIGQMFFPDFDPTIDYFKFPNITPGGYVLFGNAFEYDKNFIKDNIKKIQKESIKKTGLPLGLSVDEEGGIVNRISKRFRYEPFPSPQEVYNKSGINGILEIEQEKRNLLRKFYMNINLAPVADLSLNSKDPMYKRTIARNASESSEYIAKDVEGYVNDTFTCCLKHFPGYGNNSDTHTDKAIDPRSYATFLNEDFLPFEAGITSKAPMILISHNTVVCKDDKYPASLSITWHKILREDLNFSGLIVTDDFTMKAIKNFYTLETAAILGVKAGNDIIITGYYEEQYKAVLKAVQNKEISEDLINTAVRRIIAWKLKYLSISDFDDEPSDNNPEEKPKNNNTTLIIVLCVIGSLIVIGAIVVVIIIFKKRKERLDEIYSVDKMALTS